MSFDHFETQIQPEELTGDPRNSLSDAETIEVNDWSSFRDPGDNLIDLSAPLVLPVDNNESKMDRVQMIERFAYLYPKPKARLMVFGQWGGDTHHREETKGLLWQEWC